MIRLFVALWLAAPPAAEGPTEQEPPVAQPDPPAAEPEPHHPDSQAPPSEGVYAVGSGPLAPLPPPPPPVPASAIPKLDWRGVAWAAIRLTVTGPIGGDRPARPAVVSIGGALEGGWRINQVAALGFGVSRQAHESRRETTFEGVVVRRGHLNAWDIAFVRAYAPVHSRVEPFLDVGGGMVFFEPAEEAETLKVGGSTRLGLGFDAWVAKTLTLGASGLYRTTFLAGGVGHSIQGVVELAVRW